MCLVFKRDFTTKSRALDEHRCVPRFLIPLPHGISGTLVECVHVFS